MSPIVQVDDVVRRVYLQAIIDNDDDDLDDDEDDFDTGNDDDRDNHYYDDVERKLRVCICRLIYLIALFCFVVAAAYIST